MITDSLIVKADPLQHSGMIARLASQIWSEHYGNLLSGRQIDYMLEKFQSEPAIMEHDMFKVLHPDTDWKAGLRYAQEIGIGTREYELIEGK